MKISEKANMHNEYSTYLDKFSPFSAPWRLNFIKVTGYSRARAPPTRMMDRMDRMDKGYYGQVPSCVGPPYS